MKRFLAIIASALLLATSATTAFAAGINSAEKDVLDALQTSVTMAEGEMVIPDEFINQAENYFNTIDMTADEAEEIIDIIEEGKDFLESTGAANIADMHYTKKYELLDIGKEVVGVIDMTMSYDKTTKTLYIYAPDGETAFAATPTLTPAGELKDENIIKPTGDFNGLFGVATVGAVALVLVAVGALFIVKTKKGNA